eukprot:CAMPEP_0169281612 /NCGR_PEP_ID=MMETSP1016-20121227/56365_1 /TAXON_ID=342587 /ORGANISM="Karlodinium micrum, Strain CCMP2283" /LENGTH=466 /DNA_ID=CAMNT_0009370279 /DNA_START=61 /DNA_END=1462 /DNA_ORIENTATION=+
MVRVSLKNTFLSFDEGEDGETQRMRESASPRSRSAEAPMSPPRQPQDYTDVGMNERLDISLVLPPGVGSQGGSPRQCRTPRSRANSDQIPSPKFGNALPRPNIIAKVRQCITERSARDGSSDVATGEPMRNIASADITIGGGAKPGHRASTATASSEAGRDVPSREARAEFIPNVNSNGSISTMGGGSESGEEGNDSRKRLIGASLMHQVWSSNSVSTLGEQSDIVEDEGIVEFNLHIEEEAPAVPFERGRQAAPFGDIGSPTNAMEKSGYRQQQMQQQMQQQRSLPKEYRHGHVPKNLDLAEEYRKSAPENPPTTLMIRNIPNRYTQRELIVELEDLGFAGTFDFLYVPLDKGTMSNVGYAFVNFVQPEHAEKCIQAFQGYKFKKHRKVSGKIAAVSIAHIQGLEANLAHYKNAAVNTAKMKQRRPLVMANISQSLLNAVGGSAAPEQGASTEGFRSKLQEFHVK